MDSIMNEKFDYGLACDLELSENRHEATADRIIDITDGLKQLLLYKNMKYGDSALKPQNVFYKGDSLSSIQIRMDDKIGRIRNNHEDKPRVNDVADLIGYGILMLISMGVTKKDLEKFMD